MERLVIETEEDWEKVQEIVSSGVKRAIEETMNRYAPQSAIPGYTNWLSMRQRCYYEKQDHYHLYGGRGIKVCDRWRNSFRAFIADMGHRPSSKHSIDRIDPNGNYEPSNCRWATKKQQGENQRKTIKVRVDGEEKTLREWADLRGISFSTLYNRLVLWGWPAEEAVNTGLHARWKRRVA